MMELFKKKETLTQSIAFMGIMAAINVGLVLLSYFVPVLLFLLIIILPITSTLVTLLCDKKYYLIYAIATLAISFLITLNNITDTLLFVLPSLVNGFILGIIIEKKFSSAWIIISLTTVTLIFFFAFVPLINGIYKENIIEVVATVFGLKDFKYLDYLSLITVFFISIIQAILSYIISKIILRKIQIFVNDNIKPKPLLIAGLISTALIILFAFTYKPLSFLFSLYLVYFVLTVIIDSICALNKIEIIEIVVSFIIGFFLFGICYQYIPQPLGLLLINIPFVLSLVTLFVNKCFIKSKRQVK